MQKAGLLGSVALSSTCELPKLHEQPLYINKVCEKMERYSNKKRNKFKQQHMVRALATGPSRVAWSQWPGVSDLGSVGRDAANQFKRRPRTIGRFRQMLVMRQLYEQLETSV